jgi:hypothetical protein
MEYGIMELGLEGGGGGDDVGSWENGWQLAKNGENENGTMLLPFSVAALLLSSFGLFYN